MTAVSNPKL